MPNLHNQAIVYTATSKTVIRKSNETPIRATTNTNVERQHEKKASQFSFFRNQFLVSFETDFQFLSKPTLEMLLFPSLYAKKCVHSRFFYVWHAMNAEFWPSVIQDQHNLPNKRQHPSTPKKHERLPSNAHKSQSKTVPNIKGTSHL